MSATAGPSHEEQHTEAQRAPDARGVPVPTAPGLLLSLQRTAGNRAVAGVLHARGTPVVQRLSVTSSQFPPPATWTERATQFAGVGMAPHVAIWKYLVQYEQNKGKQEQEAWDRQWEALAGLGEACDKWLATQGAEANADKARAALVARLQQELPMEQADLAKRQAQDIYLRNLAGATNTFATEFSTNEARTAARGAMQDYAPQLSALEAKGAVAGDDALRLQQLKARMALVKAHGLTPAENAAITAYTAEDYQYMNPATANSPERMEKFLEGRGTTDPQQLLKEAKTARQEGSMHTSVIISGLRKLDPFKGSSYRGEATTQELFNQFVSVGGKADRPNLLSTGKGTEIALGFAASVKPWKPIAVLWVFEHTGQDSGGRDIAAFSELPGEGEVLIMPGHPFTITSKVRVKPGHESEGGAHGDFYKEILGQPAIMQGAEKVYLVVATADPKPAPAAAGGPAGAGQA